MKYILLATLLLTGCNIKRYSVMICPKDGQSCQLSNTEFETQEICEQFAARADAVQPNIKRICVEYTAIN